MRGLLSGAASRWIRRQERIFHPLGRGLTETERAAFTGFFDAALLARVRLHRLEHPRTLAALVTVPARLLPFELRHLAGITFGDTIVLTHRAPAGGPDWYRLLFHELVHVVQYDLLGVDRFVDCYLTGWAQAGFRYREIPLERDARALEWRFCQAPAAAFPVEKAVLEQLCRPGSPA